MDMSNFREQLRAKLQDQYKIAREGMGLPVEEDVFNIGEDSNKIGSLAKKRESLLNKQSMLAKQIAKIEADLQVAQGEMMGGSDQDQSLDLNQNDQQAFQDDIDYLDEGDEDISAQQGKNLLKFATADKIAASIMNMDEMELSNFIENGLKQAGVQLIADNLETSGGGEPVKAEPSPSAPPASTGAPMGTPEGETGGQEGNMRLADL